MRQVKGLTYSCSRSVAYDGIVSHVYARETADDLLALDALCSQIVAAAVSDAARAVEGALDFPRGLCTWASQVGGEILTERGFGSWTLWNAADESGWHRHDWLVQAELYVDLTAHQFQGIDTYLVGRGANPLARRFAFLLGTYPGAIPPGHDKQHRWKEVLVSVMAR